MSKTVDERVVSMQFDNKQFEANVNTSMSTIDKLKAKLDFKGATKGMEDIGTATKNVNMSGLGSAVESVRVKFSALEVMGVTALTNITNSAINAGKRLVSSLSVDQIKAGFQKFSDKTTSVATLQAQGNALEDVNEQLDKLNWFTDETSYNFTDMVSNIAKFTATGKGLEESVTAMEGIATWAALSGQNASTASRAMYQLSQAMGAGVMRKEDYKSIQNASMDTEEFRKKCIEAGIALGTLKDNGDGTFTSLKANVKDGAFTISQFADHLTEDAWLTSDVMMKVFNEYSSAVAGIYDAADESGKLASEIIDEIHTKADELKTGTMTDEEAIDAAIKELGYTLEDGSLKFDSFGLKAFEAAQKARTFQDAIDATKDAVSTGWMNTFEIIFGDAEEATELWTDLANAMWDVFASGAEARNEMLKGWKELGGREKLIESFWNIWDGIASIVEPIKEAFRDIFPPMTSEKLLEFTESLKELTEKIKISEETADKLRRTFKGVFAIFHIVYQAIKSLFGGFAKLVGYISPVGDGLLGFTAKIGDFIVGVDKAIESSNIFNKVVEGIGKILKPIAEGVKTFAKIVVDAFTEMEEKVEGRFKPFAALGKFIQKIFVGIGNAIKKVAPIFAAIASKIGEAFKVIQKKISGAIQNSDYSTLFDLFNGGMFAAILVGIKKFIKSLTGITDNAGDFVENINNILDGVGDALKAFTGQIKAKTLKTIAISIAILAGSLLVLSLIDSDKLAASLGAVTALFIELFGAMAIFGKLADGKKFNSINKISKAMVKLSAALLVLSVALKILSTISLEEMGVALLGMVVGLAALVITISLLPEKKVTKSAKAIKKLCSALLILSVALKIMSTISLKEMGIALLGMVVGLASLVAAVNLLPKNTALKAIGMISLATSMVILAGALKIMATMSWNDIARSLVTLAGSLTIITIAMKAMKKAIPGALALPIIAVSLVILAGALKIMATMSWDEIAKGLVALAGSLIIIAVAMKFMKKAIFGAAALLVVAGALAVLTPVLMALGSMDLAEIGKALLTLAGAFVVIGLAGLILKPLVGTILLLSASIVLLGIGIGTIGAGILLLAVGLTVLGGALAASGAAIVAFVSSIIGLIPYLIEQIGVGIIKLCEVIAGSADAICKAVTVIILAVVDALVTSIPAIVEGVFVLIEELLSSLVEHTPSIVKKLFNFLIGVINAIAEKLPELIQAGVNLLMAFFTGVIDALQSIDPEILIKGILGVGFMTVLMAALASMAIFTGPAMIGVLGFGAVITELAIVLTAIGALAQIPGLEWLVSEGGNFLQKVGTAIGQFVGGLIGGIGMGISSALPQIGTDLSAFMTNIKPFIDGAKLIDSSVIDGVKELVGVVMALTAANFLEGITSWLTGGSSLSEFGEEIAAFGPYMKAYADSVAGIDVASMQAATEAAKAITAMADTIPNEGGVIAWFAGDNSIAAFGEQLPLLGAGLLGFSVSVAGINPDNVVAAAEAAKAITAMADTIPNEGGVVAWFAGDNSISTFGTQLPLLGAGLLGFSVSVAGINPDNITAAASAAKSLAEMTTYIPNEGGIVSWFAGDNSISGFGTDLISLGQGLKGFADETSGIIPDNITAAASAAKSLAEMTTYIPNEGGIKAWFSGDSGVSTFSDNLPILGEGLSAFSDSVSGINPDNITASVKVAKDLAYMANTVPEDSSRLPGFGENIVIFGEKLESYYSITGSISYYNIFTSLNALSAFKTVDSFSKSIDPSRIKSATEAIEDTIHMIKKMSSIRAESTTGFVEALNKLGEANVTDFVDALNKVSSDLKTAGKNAIDNFIEGANQNIPKVESASKTIVIKFADSLSNGGPKIKVAFGKVMSSCCETIKMHYTKFVSAGKCLVQGFASGISKNSFIAEIKAAAMADSAYEAAKEALDINSPSKIFRKLGFSIPEGLAMGIDKLGYVVGNSVISMTDSAIGGTKDAISRIASIVTSDIDAQPTIRPVLDLSDIKSGANAIGNMLNGRTISVAARNVGTINSMMRYNQNGTNSDVISAIEDLGRRLGNGYGNTYNINGITYDDGSEVSNAIKTLIRAAKIERRS